MESLKLEAIACLMNDHQRLERIIDAFERLLEVDGSDELVRAITGHDSSRAKWGATADA